MPLHLSRHDSCRGNTFLGRGTWPWSLTCERSRGKQANLGGLGLGTLVCAPSAGSIKSCPGLKSIGIPLGRLTQTLRGPSHLEKGSQTFGRVEGGRRLIFLPSSPVLTPRCGAVLPPRPCVLFLNPNTTVVFNHFEKAHSPPCCLGERVLLLL